MSEMNLYSKSVSTDKQVPFVSLPTDLLRNQSLQLQEQEKLLKKGQQISSH